MRRLVSILFLFLCLLNLGKALFLSEDCFANEPAVSQSTQFNTASVSAGSNQTESHSSDCEDESCQFHQCHFGHCQFLDRSGNPFLFTEIVVPNLFSRQIYFQSIELFDLVRPPSHV